MAGGGMGQMSEHMASISAGEGGGGLRGAVSSLTPHDLQIETQTGVCAYCFLVLSSRNEYIPDGPVNDAEWAAHQVPLTLSSILLTFCNIHRPRSPSSTSSSSTSLPVSISHSFWPSFPLLLLALFDMVVWDDVAIKISHRYWTVGTLCIDSVK